MALENPADPVLRAFKIYLLLFQNTIVICSRKKNIFGKVEKWEQEPADIVYTNGIAKRYCLLFTHYYTSPVLVTLIFTPGSLPQAGGSILSSIY